MKVFFILSIIITVMLLLLFLAFIVGNYFLSFLVAPKIKSQKLLKRIATKEGGLKYISSFEDFEIKMRDGYLIHGQILKNTTDKFVICSHGLGASSYTSYKYANIFYENGYSVICYDSRGHGENEKHLITLGHYEASDLSEMITYVKEKYQVRILGLHGESMGAIISLLTLKYHDDLNFVIADSAFSDLFSHIKYQLKNQYQLPSFVRYLGAFACLIKYHFSLKEISPIKYLDNRVKKLFIHSKSDEFILVDQAISLNEKAKNSQLYLFDKSKHADNLNHYPSQYQELITKFLNEVEVS